MSGPIRPELADLLAIERELGWMEGAEAAVRMSHERQRFLGVAKDTVELLRSQREEKRKADGSNGSRPQA